MRHAFRILVKLEAGTSIVMGVIRMERIKTDVPRKYATMGTCRTRGYPCWYVERAPSFQSSVYAQNCQHFIAFLSSCAGQPTTTYPGVRDFEFLSENRGAREPSLTIHAHLMDPAFSYVLVRNDTDEVISVGSKGRVGNLGEANYVGCYHLVERDHGLATARPAPPDLCIEHTPSNGITLYRDREIWEHLTEVVDKNACLWIDKVTTVKVDPDHRMHNLVDN